MTDAGLKELARLKNLTTLGLVGTQVTDVGLKELGTLKNLTRLSLAARTVTDAGLKELARLKNLTTLDLGYTKVTDAGLKGAGTAQKPHWARSVRPAGDGRRVSRRSAPLNTSPAST